MNLQKIPQLTNCPNPYFLGLYHDGIDFSVVRYNPIQGANLNSTSIDRGNWSCVLVGFEQDRISPQPFCLYENNRLIFARTYRINNTEYQCYYSFGQNGSTIAIIRSRNMKRLAFSHFTSNEEKEIYENSLYLDQFSLGVSGENKILLTGEVGSLRHNYCILNAKPVRPVSATKFAFGGNFIAYYNTRSIYFYEAIGYALKRKGKLSYPGHIVDVKISPDSKTLLVVGKTNIYLYDTQTFQLIKTMFVHENSFRARFCAWAKDGLTFAVASKNYLCTFDFDS